MAQPPSRNPLHPSNRQLGAGRATGSTREGIRSSLRRPRFWGTWLVCLTSVTGSQAVELPRSVQAVWSLETASRETTPTRERVCLNGLWQWQPALSNAKRAPTNTWGYFKVPGCWPGITDYMQKDSQTVYPDPSWTNRNLREINAAWYQREITTPTNWNGRRMFLAMEYLNSYAAIYLDGRPVGEVRFPGGELDLTDSLQPGTHRLSLLVVALPLKAVMLSYTDSESAREQKGSVARRGLCGDVFLVSRPSGPSLGDVKVQTSVRNKELTIISPVERLPSDAHFQVRVKIFEGQTVVKQFVGASFTREDLRNGEISLHEKWLPDKLWDITTPTNQYRAEVTLLNNAGEALDTSWTVRFGARELRIEGRDFYLNGTRIFLSAVPLDNAEVSAALATYDAARESLERLKSIGINFVYTHNYSCVPGTHLGFEEVLRAADDVGMLVSLSQPHFSHYDWKAARADENNGYARHAAYYVHAAGNHPSVVFYSMSHNATGYDEDMNPDMIDGIHDARDSWSLNNAAMAKRAEAIVSSLDPSRIVYHHASGNLGPMHAINFYPNFVPVQELSDWFEHWSMQGVKPVFTCEYGAPFTWDWTMYRGWYHGQREFGSAAVPWEFCLAEWNAQLIGDKAFAVSQAEKENLRWEAAQFRTDGGWHRWDYPAQVGSTRLEERYPIFASYIADNWRAFRTWEVSATSPWEYEHFWKLREGVQRRRQDYKTDWQSLQRPGFSPDYQDQRYERMDLAYERRDWVPTAAAKALMANNAPVLAYLAGKAGAFTSKDHIFRPGETIEKQVVIINNSRSPLSGALEWVFKGPGGASGTVSFSIPTGQQKRSEIRFQVPPLAAPGSYELSAVVKFSTGELQTDSLLIDVVGSPATVGQLGKVAIFDPTGETTQSLSQLGVLADSVQADADLAKYDLLLIGKKALSITGPGPDLTRVKEGLKVILFEQTAEVLEKRLGFRVQEYGLRQVYPRVPDHPALAGLTARQFQDWRGESTLLPPRLKYESRPQYGPTVEWCGIRVPHLWRCGNRGDVASVLIEKPVIGDFLPIVDGGFSLQYSPLLEYHEGAGLIIFCQMDVSGRTDPEPSAEALCRNLLAYVGQWHAPSHRTALYAGGPEGRLHLEQAGIPYLLYAQAQLTNNTVLVVGPGGGKVLGDDAARLKAWMDEGGRLLALGLDQQELASFTPQRIVTKRLEHISAFFPALSSVSFAAGIGPADLHNRAPQDFPLLLTGAETFGDGVLGQSNHGSIILCQMAPWSFGDDKPNTKRTHRRSSFAVSRLLANMGVSAPTPLVEHIHTGVGDLNRETRWLSGLYMDVPSEWDDPYRHFRW